MAPSSYNTTFGKLKNFPFLYSKKGRGARLRSPFFHMNEKILKTRIKQRRDTVANWTNNNPVLLKGEIAIVEDTDGAIRFKVGDGSKTFSALAYTDEKLKAEIATKGNKLAAAGSETMPVYIKSDGTASAINALSHRSLSWSGAPMIGNLSPVDAALSYAHSANRLQFMNPAAITIERSTDGGQTWAEAVSGITEAKKIYMVSHAGTDGIIDATESGVTFSMACQLRITLDATTAGIYCGAQNLLINFSTRGAKHVRVKFEKAKKDTPNDFQTVWTYYIEGYSGWNSYPMKEVFGGYPNQNNTSRFRFTFFLENEETTETSLIPFQVFNIFLFSTNSWIACSNMANHGYLYDWDVNQNAIFPAKIIGGYEPSTPAQALTAYTALSSRGATNDLNQSLSRGISYYGDENATNTPSDAGKYGTLVNLLNMGETQNNTDNWLTQIASTTTNRLFSRTKINDGNFSKWEEIIKIADDDYFVLDGGTSTTVI